jgi:hypothetical protein
MAGHKTSPLSVSRISGITDSGRRLNPIYGSGNPLRARFFSAPSFPPLPAQLEHPREVRQSVTLPRQEPDRPELCKCRPAIHSGIYRLR